jgi:hypothetical protein
MKRVLVLLALAGLALSASALTLADDRADRNSPIEQGRLYLQWMKEQAGKLEQELQQARREKNDRKINCIEDRLATLKELLNESDGEYQRLRALALQQRVSEARKVFAKLSANQKLAEQLVELVNECFRNINEPGGFVESLEEWLGELPGDGEFPDPTETRPRPGNPEPLPIEFTPGPVSEEK